MKLVFLLFLALGAIAWSVEDQEIFKVNHELQQDHPGMTFYDFFQLPKGSKSSFKEINKQFKRLSIKYHPDKSRESAKVALRNYERLSVIANILKSSSKDRYDFFLKNGFPKYKNNQFLYEKFKPGLIFTILFLYLLVGIAHYIILQISAVQDRKRIQGLIDQIKGYAIQQSSNGIITEPRKYKLEAYKNPFLVRIDGVFVIEDEDTMQLSKLSADVIKTPRIVDSLLVKLPLFLWNKTLGQIPALKVEFKPVPEPESIDETHQTPEPKKKKKPKGDKLVLPNGKVVYGKKK